MWKYTGQQRPEFAIEPAADQESVWDYPRPPALIHDKRHIEVFYQGQRIAASRNAIRVCETASPPTFYLPPQDVQQRALVTLTQQSFCEWKGRATYWAIKSEQGAGQAIAWTYEQPTQAFAAIAGYFCFYPSRVDAYVDEEHVRAQAGDFYGGWITDEIVGPFKGDPGTGGW